MHPLKPTTFSLLFAVFLGLCGQALAQTARWGPPGGKLPVGIFSELQLEFVNCEPRDTPQPPKVPGLTLVLRGTASNTSMENFRTTTLTLTYTFAVRLDRKERVEIPAFTVETDKGPQRIASAVFEPGDNTNGGQASLEDIARTRIELSRPEVWAGEVFPLTYRLEVLRRFYRQLASNPRWDPTPLTVEDWERPQQSETGGRSSGSLVFTYRTRALASAPGPLTLNAIQQLVNIGTSTSLGFIAQEQQLSLASDQPALRIKPLPTPAPASFTGAVGRFKLESRIVPRQAALGEPITWTLELSGEGNWPAIQHLPSRAVPKSLEVIQPQSKRSLAEGKLFQGSLSEDIVLFPKQAGAYTLPSLQFSFFDPDSGEYVTLNTEAVTLQITGSEANKGPTQGPRGGESLRRLPDGSMLPPPPSAPSPIPEGLAAQTGYGATPLTPEDLRFRALLLLPLLPLLWLALAVHSAWKADPNRPRRAALKRLLHLLTTENVPARERLLAWQRETCVVLGLSTAAPVPASLSASSLPAAKLPLWQALWTEADTLLYAATPRLPSDWLDRARKAAVELHRPGFPLRSVLRVRHWLPWLACLALLLSLSIPALAAAKPAAKDPASLYANGDFAGARDAWLSTSTGNPLNWAARHNLGLALLQLDQSGSAAAHLGAALALHPQSDTLRHNYRVAAAAAGATPTELAFLAEDGPLPALARLCSPSAWQEVLLLSLLAALLALALLLLNAFFWRRRALPLFCWSALGLSFVLGLFSLFVVERLGPLAHPEAALVWQNTTLRSIPTEADASQKTAALQSGTLLTVNRSLLGWRHVSLSSGESGWLRREDLIGLYRAP